MKCNWEWLSAYLDGALGDEKRAKLEEHLKTCEVCTAKLEEFARVEQMAQKIPAPQLSEAYWENFASRVQNKLTIRERQRTSPGWLEALKNFFQPSTGKLAIAGSVAVLILLTFISLDQWKQGTFRPPVFEAEKPVVEGKIDSVPVAAKDESAFRTKEAANDKKVGLVEDKRLDQPAPERGKVALSQKPAEIVPAASALPLRALAAPEEQKSKEEPSMAAYAERDETAKKDSGFVTADKKTKETERASLQNELKLQGRTSTLAPSKGRIQSGKVNDTVALSSGVEANSPAVSKETTSKFQAPLENIPEGHIQEYIRIKGGFGTEYGNNAKPANDTAKAVSDSQAWSLIRGLVDGEYGNKAKPAIDTANRDSNYIPHTIDGGPARNILKSNAYIDYTRKQIKEFENELRNQIPRARAESIYVFLGNRYLNLCLSTLLVKDWKTADRRVNDFLKKELSDYTRQHLLQIQAELKKLQK